MKEVLEILIKNLVEQKDKVIITETEDGNYITYSVKVDQTDMGKVIGKQGRIAKSIRNIMKAVSGKEHKKVDIEFVD